MAKQKFCEKDEEGGTEVLDKSLTTRVMEENDIEKLVEEFHEVMELACSRSFRKLRATKKVGTHKAVPWWTEYLIMRKRLKALRYRY